MRQWIYVAERALSREEQVMASEQVSSFVDGWSAHGIPLEASGRVEDGMVVLHVNESKHAASGCSIDASVHFIKDLGQKLNCDFFNRLVTVYKDQNAELHWANPTELKALIVSGKVSGQTMVCNALAQDSEDQLWVKLEDAWQRKYL